jgi:2-keto-4-pentenoate hydratase/2-oxohepta-3-ene-1,7-dioic acid hydratase in catechol pathway
MKIFAIGLNYASHNDEMKHTFQSTAPVVFMKPDTALLKDGNPFFLPDFSEQIDYETEIVVRINRLGKNIAERFAHRYYDEVTVGVDFTARDLQREFRRKGLPWELCKGFDGSAAMGDFVSLAPFFRQYPSEIGYH